jgi:hypothetical protein
LGGDYRANAVYVVIIDIANMISSRAIWMLPAKPVKTEFLTLEDAAQGIFPVNPLAVFLNMPVQYRVVSTPEPALQ